MSENMQLAMHLLVARRSQNLEQQDIADAVGVSRQLVSKWERGKSVPDALQIVKLSRATEVPVEELLDLRDGVDEGVSRNGWLSRGPFGPYHQPGLFDPEVTDPHLINLRDELVTSPNLNISSALAAA